MNIANIVHIPVLGVHEVQQQGQRVSSAVLHHVLNAA